MRWPADVSPASLKQPDDLSCGATAVVAARLVWGAAEPADPRSEILRTHRGLVGSRDATGRAQLPWPRALGTPPWAVARALADLTGQPVRTKVVRLGPRSGFDELVSRVQTRPVVVYVGDTWLPRHVVLAFDTSDAGDAVRVFEPAHGRLLTVPRGRWQLHELGIAGWSHFWFVV